MKELLGASIAILLLSLAILTFYRWVNDGPGAWKQYKQEQSQEYESSAAPFKRMMTEGHSLWSAERQSDAVRQYKAVLLESGRRYLGDELSVIYRRVIEYEADYGDPAEARDWCVRATNEWNLRLSFSSTAAENIWMEVTSDVGRSGQPTREWERVLNR